MLNIGDKYGCLEILDTGTYYQDMMDTQIACINQEKKEFLEMIENDTLKRKDWHGHKDGRDFFTPAYIYTPTSFPNGFHESIRVVDFDEAIERILRKKENAHYKCKCTKCGKIRYYKEETLKTEPDFCFKPMYCSDRFTYSVRAQNATYHKKQKYKDNESVRLVSDRDLVIPDDEYCEKWNRKRSIELRKQAEKDAAIISSIPRRYAENYTENFVGMKYESLDVLECTDEALESAPIPYYTQQHHKKYRDIVVYKQYKCKCYLCGNDIITTCDKFGIYPPTEYGITAYNGYWSKLYCHCHPISSFQWIVNRILIENKVPYCVEETFPDLYGVSRENLLRFDFAIFNQDGSIKCLIECQGEQHFKPVDEFGGIPQFERQQQNDMIKREYAEQHNFPLIEITYKRKKYQEIEKILRAENVI